MQYCFQILTKLPEYNIINFMIFVQSFVISCKIIYHIGKYITFHHLFRDIIILATAIILKYITFCTKKKKAFTIEQNLVVC